VPSIEPGTDIGPFEIVEPLVEVLDLKL